MRHDASEAWISRQRFEQEYVHRVQIQAEYRIAGTQLGFDGRDALCMKPALGTRLFANVFGGDMRLLGTDCHPLTIA